MQKTGLFLPLQNLSVSAPIAEREAGIGTAGIIARRAIQRRLDTIRTLLGEKEIAKLARRLNNPKGDRLAAMWEVVVPGPRCVFTDTDSERTASATGIATAHSLSTSLWRPETSRHCPATSTSRWAQACWRKRSTSIALSDDARCKAT